eukprot:598425-Pleurochrysis_carterae.AAC.1
MQRCCSRQTGHLQRCNGLAAASHNFALSLQIGPSCRRSRAGCEDTCAKPLCLGSAEYPLYNTRVTLSRTKPSLHPGSPSEAHPHLSDAWHQGVNPRSTAQC